MHILILTSGQGPGGEVQRVCAGPGGAEDPAPGNSVPLHHFAGDKRIKGKMCHKYLTKFQANTDKDRVKHLTRQGTGGTPLSTFLKTVRTDTTNKIFS